MTSQWSFVIAAYAVTLGATLVLLVASYLDMHRAERRREDMRGR